MTATVATATPQGFEGLAISVECDASRGLPSLQIVGLGNKAINEARQRVRAGLRNCGFPIPARRLTVNLAPADLPKHGSHFDLPIAVAISAVGGLLKPAELAGMVMAGELGLDGSLKPVKGALQIIEAAAQAGAKGCIIPAGNAAQARLVRGLPVYALTNITEVILLLKKQREFPTVAYCPTVAASTRTQSLCDIVGQPAAIRAATVAAAGCHHLLMTGPPGVGKSMVGRGLQELLPSLSPSERIAVTKLHSLDDSRQVVSGRPFRAPHHSASHVAVIGGGRLGLPGEVSLAHRGVLFLDELPEFNRATLEALRQPLEDRRVQLARANQRYSLPCDTILVATRNPCPCGYYGDPQRACRCPSGSIERYQRKTSGPLLDRFDITIELTRPSQHALPLASVANNTAALKVVSELRQAVAEAWRQQLQRYGPDTTNASASQEQLLAGCQLEAAAGKLLRRASQNLQLSARAHFKTLRVARSIADLAASPGIRAEHVAEALQYRQRETS